MKGSILVISLLFSPFGCGQDTIDTNTVTEITFDEPNLSCFEVFARLNKKTTFVSEDGLLSKKEYLLIEIRSERERTFNWIHNQRWDLSFICNDVFLMVRG
jgi:hypothetical protein